MTNTYIQATPPEIFDHILSFVPKACLQRTALSLRSVFPNAAISDRHIWAHLVVARPEQLVPLWTVCKNAQQTTQYGPRSVKTIELQSWKGNADILVNILPLLPQLETLRLCIGTNFNPEHLEDIFLTPRPRLSTIDLRFRPYVNSVSYHQFLSGIYYDTFVNSLASWPVTPATQPLTLLSLVQDVPPRYLVDPKAPRPPEGGVSKEDVKEEERVQGKGGYTGHGPFPYLSDALQSAQPKVFAQPIVFFNTMCITRLSLAPIAQHTTHLRLRIPQRDICSPITSSPRSFPSLSFLDISTSNVRLQTNIPPLLRTYPTLEHLVMDHTNLFGFLGNDKQRGKECCRELGKMVVMSGMVRGKEMERSIASWEKDEALRLARRRGEGAQGGTPGGPTEVDEVADRLEALTTLDFNLNATARERRRGVRSMGISSFSIRSPSSSSSTNPLSRTALSNATASHHDHPLAAPTSITYVLPALPTLKSVSLGGEAVLTPAQRKNWEDEFELGWREGLEKLVEWALGGVGERYERSRRKAEKDRAEWETWLASQSTGGTILGDRGGMIGLNGKAKGKVLVGSKASAPKPPPEVRLYRFPRADELAELPALDVEADSTDRLRLVSAEEDWRSVYADALLREMECVCCFVPENPGGGPLRRGGESLARLLQEGGEEEEEEDENEEEERGGRTEEGHRLGCGHLVGRMIWSDGE